MPRQVEILLPRGWTMQAGVEGPSGMALAKSLGYQARFVGGWLEWQGGPTAIFASGWNQSMDQSLTLKEAEALRLNRVWRLDPYLDQGPAAIPWANDRVHYPDPVYGPIKVPTKYTVTERPQWLVSRNDQPGHCACGIVREMCEYHRA